MNDPGLKNIPSAAGRYGAAALTNALRKMLLIRRFDESEEESNVRGLVHGTMHLSIGQEASAVGACMGLQTGDRITSTHRGHGHCIARGADADRMFAELFSKKAGYSWRGDTMRISDVEKCKLGANGIMGGGLPIGLARFLSPAGSAQAR